ASVELEGGSRVTGQVISVPKERPYVNHLQLVKGRDLEQDEPELTCLVERRFASFNRLNPGDHVYVLKNGRKLKVKVAGVVASPEYIIVFRNRQFPMTSASAYGIFYFNEQQARFLLDFPPGSYNEFAFRLYDYQYLPDVQRDAVDALSPYQVKEVTTRENQISNTLLEMDLQQMKNFALFFPVLFFSIAAFSIYMILSRMVRIQRPTIGLLRAMGFSRRQVMFHYLSFALLVGVAGLIAGMVFGWVATWIVTRIYSTTLGIPFVSLGFYPLALLIGAVVALGFCALAGLVPARESARVQPTEALRGQIDPVKYGRKTLVERVVPLFSRTKVFWRLPLRNVLRNRRRTAFTVIGIVFAVVLIMMNLGLNDTVNANMERAFQKQFTFDIAVLFLEPQSKIAQRKLEEIPGVLKVEPTVGAPCHVRNGSRELESVVLGIEPRSEMRGFLNERNELVTVGPGSCLISKNYREELGLQVGSVLEIEVFGRKENFRVGDLIVEPLGSFVYVPLEEARRLLGYGERSTAFYLKIDPARLDEARKELYDMEGVLSLVDLGHIRNEIKTMLSLLYLVIAVMLIFGFVMAFSLVFNTSTINIMEREQEVATMLTLGIPQWKASLSLTVENVIMGLIGLVPGYFAARFIMVQTMKLYQTDLFSFVPALTAVSVLITAFCVIVLMVLSEWPSLRHIHRLDLAQATKRRMFGKPGKSMEKTRCTAAREGRSLRRAPREPPQDQTILII
ncbi:MAG: FtsX-like permease family protein, partial [Candidatus Geothermincolales bacterium]